MDHAPGELLIVRCTDGVARLRAGVLDAYAQRAYLVGQCHALSIALHERTGWPIMAVLARRGRQDRIDWTARLADAPLDVLAARWVHTAVRRHDGLLIDITGACDEATMLSRWTPPRTTDGARLVPVNAQTLLGLVRRGSGVEADVTAARTFVDAVLVAAGKSTEPVNTVECAAR
jgi:hypothetical protein